MKTIQLILLGGFFPAFWFVLNLRRMKLGRLFLRVGLFLLILSYFFTLIFPEQFNSIAIFLGVGRGADLVLYAIAAAFIFFVFAVLAKISIIDRKITIIVKEIAILSSSLEKNKK